MKVFEIEEVKEFMQSLLVSEKYDSFYLYEARVKTAMDYYINGQINEDFFDSRKDLLEAIDETGEALEDSQAVGSRVFYMPWKKVKQTVFDAIKGSRLPISFKIVLMFHNDNIKRLVTMNQLSLRPEDVSALFMNIIYENGELKITTGTSLKIFTMDKTLEHLWDESVEKYYC